MLPQRAHTSTACWGANATYYSTTFGQCIPLGPAAHTLSTHTSSSAFCCGVTLASACTTSQLHLLSSMSVPIFPVTAGSPKQSRKSSLIPGGKTLAGNVQHIHCLHTGQKQLRCGMDGVCAKHSHCMFKNMRSTIKSNIVLTNTTRTTDVSGISCILLHTYIRTCITNRPPKWDNTKPSPQLL